MAGSRNPRTRHLVPIVLVISACAPASSERTKLSTPVVASAGAAPPVAPAPSASPAEPVLPQFFEITEPGNAVCRVSDGLWTFDKLRLSENGEPFATVIDAAGAVVLPTTDAPTHAVASFDLDQITLRALIKAEDLHFFARAPLHLLGVLTPDGDAELAWRGADSSGIRVEHDGAGVLSAAVSDRVPCKDIGLVATKVDARKFITDKKTLPKRYVVESGAKLARESGGEPVAELAGATEVEVLQTRGATTRVLATGYRFVVSGWVASKDLTRTMMKGLYGVGEGYGKPGQKIASGTYSSCPIDLALFAEIGSERAHVGTIRAGAIFDPARPEPGAPGASFIPVNLPYATWLALQKNARLLVSSAELDTCENVIRARRAAASK